MSDIISLMISLSDMKGRNCEWDELDLDAAGHTPNSDHLAPRNRTEKPLNKWVEERNSWSWRSCWVLSHTGIKLSVRTSWVINLNFNSFDTISAVNPRVRGQPDPQKALWLRPQLWDQVPAQGRQLERQGHGPGGGWGLHRWKQGGPCVPQAVQPLAPRGGDQHPLLRPPAPPFFNARTRCETTAARSVSPVKTFEELFIFTLFYLTIF